MDNYDMEWITEEELQRRLDGILKELDALKKRIEGLESRPLQVYGPAM